MAVLSPHIQNARVLIVDDNLTNVLLLQRLLESEGYTNVEGVTDPREVIPLYEAQPYDLVLLDVMMVISHKNVIDALRALQNTYNIQGGTQHFIEYFISNYINEVSKVINDFTSILDKVESFAVMMNPESNDRITPMLIDMILDFILLLTDEKPKERGTVFSFT